MENTPFVSQALLSSTLTEREAVLIFSLSAQREKKQARPGHSINKGPRSWERRLSLSKENNRRADPERPEKTNTADENAAASERLISGQMQLFPLAPLSAVSSSHTDFSPPHWPSVCSEFSWNSCACKKMWTIPYQIQWFLVFILNTHRQLLLIFQSWHDLVLFNFNSVHSF